MASDENVATSDVSLVEIYAPPNSNSVDYSITVVAVPDIGRSCETRHWLLDGSHTSWLSGKLPSFLKSPQILEFTHGLGENSNFSWQQLTRCGDILLERLLARSAQSHFLERPLFFISHGLGGIITKRALAVLHENFFKPQFGRIISLVAGAVFLSTPHPTTDKPHEWAKLTLILKSDTKLSKKNIDKLASQLSSVAIVSQSFEKCSFDAPVLSTYDGQKSKTGPGLFAKHELFVDKSFARTKSRDEALIEADSDHANACILSEGSALFGQLRDMLVQSEKLKIPTLARTGTNPAISVAGWTVTSIGQGERHMSDETYPMLSVSKNVTSGSTELSGYDIVPFEGGTGGASVTVNLPCYLYKPYTRNSDFHGRQSVLESIRNSLLLTSDSDPGESSTVLKTFALCGIGGLGKTQIAVEYAFTSQDHFDAIFFLQASEASKLAQGFADISLKLGLESAETQGDQIVSKDLVLGWLSQPVRYIYEGTQPIEDAARPDPRWLLIFDNADDLDVLADYWPHAGNRGSILVTSRDPLAKSRTHIPITNGIDLEPFNKKEAGELLRYLTGLHKDTAENLSASEAVAEKLSGLPLALSAIAGTITRRSLDFDELLALYHDHSLRLEFTKLGVHGGDKRKALYTVWAFEDLSAEALNFLNLAAFLDPDQIPESLYTNILESDNAHILPDTYPKSMKAFVDARTELAKSSLVRRNIDTKELTIHRIIQDTTRDRMSAESLRDSFDLASEILYHSWQFSRFDHNIDRWRHNEPIVPHISNIHRVYQAYEALQVANSNTPALARLFMDLGCYHIERGNIPAARPFLKSSAALCELAPEKAKLTHGDVLGRLAQIGFITGDNEASVTNAQKSVEVFEPYKEDYRLAQAYNELAEAYINAGRFEESIVLAEKSHHAFMTLPEPEYIDWPHISKGISLIGLGRYEEADKVLADNMAVREEMYGPNDTESCKPGICMFVQGRLRRCQGLFDESLDFYIKSLSQFHSTLGLKHYRVACCYHNMGEVYLLLDKPLEASMMFNRSLDSYGDRSIAQAWICRTHFRRAAANTALGKMGTVNDDRRQAQELLKSLSKKQKKIITEKDLERLIPNWSK